jgi:hypothetical protein
MYKQMMNDYVTWLKTKDNEPRVVVAQLAVTKALRLQQIISGFAKDDAVVASPRYPKVRRFLPVGPSAVVNTSRPLTGPLPAADGVYKKLEGMLKKQPA